MFILSFTNTFALNINEADLYSDYVTVLEVSANKVETIDSKNGDYKMYPASMTKLLTVYVAISELDDYDKKITILPTDVDGLAKKGASLAGFMPGEVISIDDLLHGILLPSGADAIRALVRIISGREEDFVKLMNKTAKELGMKNSNFKNPTGLHDQDHYTTTNDLALLMEKALEIPKLKQMMSTMQYEVTPTNIHLEGLKFNNTLVEYSKVKGVDVGLIEGGKTGWTPEAGYCLVSFANYNDKTIIVATGNAKYRGFQLNDHNHLLDKLINQKHQIEVFKENEEVGIIKVNYAKDVKEIILTVPKDVNVEVSKIVNKDDLEIKVNYPKTLNATIKEDTKLGSFKVSYNDEVLYDYNFINNDEIKFSLIAYILTLVSLLSSSQNFIYIYLTIFMILIILIYLTYNYRNKKKYNK